MASTFLQRTQELQDTYKLSALEAARQAREEVTSPTASANFQQRQSNIANKVAENTPPIVPPTTTPIVDTTTTPPPPPPPVVTPDNKAWLVEDKTNQVLWDTMSNYSANKTIDKTQLDDTKLSVEASSLALDVELKRKQLEDIELAKEEDRIQKQKATDDANNLAALQLVEREQGAALIASTQAKNDSVERETAIQNEIALQQSYTAMGKLWLTLSTVGINSAQKINTDWLYNLAKLKTENAYNLSSLKVQVAKVEFDHTTAINKIVNDSSNKSYAIRKTLNDDIHKINNSIIDNRLSRVEKINAAVDAYQKATEDNEANTLKLVQSAATTLDDITKSMYETLKVKESYSQDKINTLATSGKWFTLTPAKRLAAEVAAWLPKGTVVAQVKANIGKWIADKLEWIAGISAGKINWLIYEALKLMDTWGYGMDAAISVALTNSPEYQTQLKLAEAKKNKVSSGGSKWSSTTGIYTTTEMIKWVPTTVEYKKGDTSYRIERGQASTATSATERTDGWDEEI